MATITYNLSAKINKDGQSEIIMNIQPQRGLHYRLKTGVFATKEQFDRLMKADRITSLDYLSVLEERLYEAFPCGKDKAEEILNSVMNSDDLISSYRNFYQSRIIEKGLTDGTQELYHSIEKLLGEYLGGRPASVKVISSQFLNGYIQYMTDKGLANVTQLNYWRGFKVYLSYLVEQGLADQKLLMYKPKFKQPENEVIYLTRKELYRMLWLNLSKKPSYAKVRDCFIVQCLTGLRHSDLVNIRKENIREDGNGKYITLLTKKTSQRLKIYLNHTCCEILQRYDWTLPRFGKEYSNETLPLIAEMAGIDEEVEVVRYVGTERIVFHRPKYRMIKTHTARRTFICLSIEAGVSTSVIRSITGHRQLSSFQRYVNVGDRKKSEVGELLEI